MTSKKFEELYKQLNREQKLAVDSVEGPVMVIAGPGTGKTQVLALRAANILLKTHAAPSNILALTFTEGAAGQMRKRLFEIIGLPAYAVNISTFHGFCNDIIQSYPEQFDKILDRQAADEVSQIDILKKAIKISELKILRPFGNPFYYLREVRLAVSRLKKEGVGEEDFSKILEKEGKIVEKLEKDLKKKNGKSRTAVVEARKQLDKNLELLEIYKNYQKGLTAAKLYDFDDMILEVVKTLSSDKNLLVILQERYQYILVDEHQDTNSAQNKVLELICNFYDQPNLFVVGDEKQAIFRFQGASLENFLYFRKLYPKAKLVALSKNYRSSQAILDAAQSFIALNKQSISSHVSGLPDKLSAQLKHPSRPVEIFKFSRSEAENYFIAKKISELVKSGASLAEIAVIYRDNADALPIARMLDKFGLARRIESNRNVLDDVEIRKLVAILEFLNDFSSEEKLLELLHFDFLNILSLDIFKLVSARRAGPILELMSDASSLKKLKIKEPEKMAQLAEKLLRWKKLSKNKALPEFFEIVVTESGFLGHILAEKNSAFHLNRLDAFFSEVKNLCQSRKDFSLAGLIEYLASLRDWGLAVKEANFSAGPEAVKMMTAHGAKGLEFDYVFMAGACDGHWGGRRTKQLIKLPAILETAVLDGEGDDEERRLFFVAMTRARKEIFISFSERGAGGKTELSSRFIGEIKPELKKEGQAEKYERELEKNAKILFLPPACAGRAQSIGVSVSDKKYLNDLFLEQGLSATALNNFLACPWRYFYANLLRLPQAQTKQQIYGRAVHAALKDFFDALALPAQAGGKNRKDRPTKEFLQGSFENFLKKEPLSGADFKETLAKGKKSLSGYFDFYKKSWNKNVRTEFRIRDAFLKIGKENIRLSGFLDKIEFLAGGQQANVVDYKTGRPKSRNELEGKTKDADGNYKRQLVFYKFLLSKSPTILWEMAGGEIDFVEPDEKGKFRKEKFVISGDEVKEMEKLVRETAEKILDLSFWDERCKEKDCKYCALRERLKS